MIMVSVIVPVFNRENTIKGCITSIISQSYSDLEVVLVDDGSTDRSGVICDEYSEQDDRIKTIHINNSGVANARNYGIKNSSGEYITFVDSDDYIDKDYISKLCSALEKDDCVLSVCNYTEVIDNTEHTRILYNTDFYRTEEYIDDFLYCKAQGGLCWGKLYKRDMIKALFKQYRYCEDVLFVFDYLSNNPGLIGIATDCLYNYVRHDSSITGGKKAIDLKDAVLVAEKIYEECNLNFADHIKSSRAFVVSNSFFAYLQNIEERSDVADRLRKRVKCLVSENRLKVLRDGNATVKSKGACILSFFSYRLLEALYGLMN